MRADPAFGTEAQVQVLDCLHAFGELELQAGNPAKALEWFERCQHDAEPLAKRNPPPAGAMDRLRDAWWGEAKSFTSLAKYPDALAAWDQAIALASPGQLIFLKLYRLATLARTSEYEQAMIELDPLAVQARASGEALFEVARIYAIAAQKAATDSKASPAERTRRADDAAERAVENLRLAEAKGFFAGPEARNSLTHSAGFWIPSAKDRISRNC